jgi:FtsP/CotA-like multicopper oxidase with cupredoxin domain
LKYKTQQSIQRPSLGYDVSVPWWGIFHFLRGKNQRRKTERFWRTFCFGGFFLLALLKTPGAQCQSLSRPERPAPSANTSKQNQNEICPRFPSGSALSAPLDLRSRKGVLKVELSMRSFLTADGEMRDCYLNADGSQAPTLRLHPGDLLILSLKNELTPPPDSMHSHGDGKSPCGPGMGMMSAAATNLHFHGLYLPPLCHQDETLGTLIQPSSAAFEYRVRIPRDQPPGLYWYHPHAHGFSEAQVLGGASGALIVEGIERANPRVAGLPERLLVIRDQKMPAAQTNLTAEESAYLPEKPSKDLSVNFVPVPYPKYPPAVIAMKPSQQQLWRVLNASADTPLDLQLLFGRKAQNLGVVALDGVPVNYGTGEVRDHIIWKSDIPLPAGGRAEFIVNGPPEGVQATLVTLGVETAPFVDEEDLLPASGPNANAVPADEDDNTPPRPLVTIVASASVPEPISKLPLTTAPLASQDLPPLARVKPVRERKLYFSEKIMDPKHPSTSTVFYITEEGQTPAAYDPSSTAANITVHLGDVEDWTIENRSQELHTFHIHQSHFVVLEEDGVTVDQPNLRDTISVRFWDGASQPYPRVKLRMDFRNPDVVGKFPYHCHILQHEDGGMMGTIQVLPAALK